MTSLLSNLLNYGVISPEERKRQLFKACWDGEIEQLKRLLSQSPDLLNKVSHNKQHDIGVQISFICRE